MVRTPSARIVLLAALAMPPCVALAQDESLVQTASRLHREQRWSAAYARYIQAANRGDRDAARIAQFMHRYDRLLYKAAWDLSPDDVEDWPRGEDRVRHLEPTPVSGGRNGR